MHAFRCRSLGLGEPQRVPQQTCRLKRERIGREPEVLEPMLPPSATKRGSRGAVERLRPALLKWRGRASRWQDSHASAVG